MKNVYATSFCHESPKERFSRIQEKLDLAKVDCSMPWRAKRKTRRVEVGAEAEVQAERRVQLAVLAPTEVQGQSVVDLVVWRLMQAHDTSLGVTHNLPLYHIGHAVAVFHPTGSMETKMVDPLGTDHAVVVYHRIEWRPRTDLY